LETRKISHFGISAARSGYVASDAVTAYMFFSLTLFEERHEKGGPGGNVRVPFLSPFLCGMTKKGHQSETANARSSVSVRRRSCKKSE
jgi:hypothetical protein